MTDLSQIASRTTVTERHKESLRGVTNERYDAIEDVDVDVEGDKEAEAEAERSRAAAAAHEIHFAFGFLDFRTRGKPFGTLAFQLEWANTIKNFHPAKDGDFQNCFVQLMEDCITRCNLKGIKVPKPFYEEKRYVEEDPCAENARKLYLHVTGRHPAWCGCGPCKENT